MHLRFNTGLRFPSWSKNTFWAATLAALAQSIFYKTEKEDEKEKKSGKEGKPYDPLINRTPNAFTVAYRG
jgi:hypothetical protein